MVTGSISPPEERKLYPDSLNTCRLTSTSSHFYFWQLDCFILALLLWDWVAHSDASLVRTYHRHVVTNLVMCDIAHVWFSYVIPGSSQSCSILGTHTASLTESPSSSTA